MFRCSNFLNHSTNFNTVIPGRAEQNNLRAGPKILAKFPSLVLNMQFVVFAASTSTSVMSLIFLRTISITWYRQNETIYIDNSQKAM